MESSARENQDHAAARRSPGASESGWRWRPDLNHTNTQSATVAVRTAPWPIPFPLRQTTPGWYWHGS